MTHCNVIMTSWSSIEEDCKRYHQNFLIRDNNEITGCIADLFNSFYEEVYLVAFFKVIQQQTTGKKSGKFNYLFVGLSFLSATVK